MPLVFQLSTFLTTLYLAVGFAAVSLFFGPIPPRNIPRSSCTLQPASQPCCPRMVREYTVPRRLNRSTAPSMSLQVSLLPLSSSTFRPLSILQAVLSAVLQAGQACC